MIHVGFISTVGRLRDVDQDQVARLAESIKEVGLLNPITVYRREIIRNGQPVEGYGLVAGAHRLEACKRLGWQEVPAVVVDLDDDDRIIAECDENLCGTKVSATEQAMFTAKRKEAYLRKHPETGHGGDRKSDQVANSATCSFAQDQAEKTGTSARTVRQNAERGEKVTPEALAMVKGTKLDTGAYLDKLKKVAPEKQVARVERDLAEAANPKADEAPDPEPTPDPYADERKGLSRFTREGLEDALIEARIALRDEKAKRKAAEHARDEYKARLDEALAGDDMGRALGNAQRQRDTAKQRMKDEQAKNAVQQRRINKLEAEVKALQSKLERQEITL